MKFATWYYQITSCASLTTQFLIIELCCHSGFIPEKPQPVQIHVNIDSTHSFRNEGRQHFNPPLFHWTT